MAITSVHGLVIPDNGLLTAAVATPSFTGLTVDASGEKAAFILAAPKTGSVRKVGFRTGTVTTPTDTDVRLETVGADGFPTGTLFGTTTNVTVASGSLSANTWLTTGALTADASVTKGDLLAVVFAPSGSPNFQIAITNAGFLTTLGAPYQALYTASWAALGRPPMVALEYSDGSYAFSPGLMPASAFTQHSISSATTPDEVALKFKTAGPVRVGGFWQWLASVNGDAWDIVLYDSDGTTALATSSFDGDQQQGVGGIRREWFNTSVTLTADTYYYLSVKPTTGTIVAYSFDVGSAGILDTLEGGQNFHYAERVDGGSWTATTTRRPIIGLIIDGIDDGAGGGGGGEGPLLGGRLVR